MKQIVKDIVFEIHEISPEPKAVRRFGFILTAILTAVTLWLYYKQSGALLWFVLGSSTSLVISLLFPRLIYPLYLGLTAVSIVIGYFVSRLILTLMFVLFFVPVGLFTRLFRRDLLDQRIDKKVASYWIKKEQAQDRRQSTELMF